MTALLLNLKQVRLRFKGDKEARLKLKLRGEGVVTAGDLEAPGHVEVVNPDLPLLSGDSARAKVDLEMSAATGYGYSPSEERAGLPIGETPIDAVFSPIRQAHFKVFKPGVAEMARAGHGYDNLVVEVKTDGTITPEGALREASARLARHLDLVAGRPWFEKEELPPLPYRRTLNQIGLQPRTKNALQGGGYETVLEVMKSLRQGAKEIKKLKGMGKHSYADLLATLEAQNLSPGDQEVLAVLTRLPKKRAEE
jgi:DNA-directed RNA polymerase subunit alpha